MFAFSTAALRVFSLFLDEALTASTPLGAALLALALLLLLALALALAVVVPMGLRDVGEEAGDIVAVAVAVGVGVAA